MSKVEEQVINKLRSRADAGKQKYGVTMERNDLTNAEWLKHLQEELMDATVYVEKILTLIEAYKEEPELENQNKMNREIKFRGWFQSINGTEKYIYGCLVKQTNGSWELTNGETAWTVDNVGHLTDAEWLKHLQEELLDAAVYVENLLTIIGGYEEDHELENQKQ